MLAKRPFAALFIAAVCTLFSLTTMFVSMWRLPLSSGNWADMPATEIDVVVAHCEEDLSFLEAFQDCSRVHLHIYSRCGAEIPDFVNLKDCHTVHRDQECGGVAYAYFHYMQDRYNNFPGMVAFLHGNANTENPHVIDDILNFLPGTTFFSLTRLVRGAWHMQSDAARASLQERLVPELLSQDSWLTSWRYQFMASRETIRSIPQWGYQDIESALCNLSCQHNEQCTIDLWVAPLFRCATFFFLEQNGMITAKHNHVMATVEADWTKDVVLEQGANPDESVLQVAESTHQIIVKDRSLVYSESYINGLFLCAKGVDPDQVSKWLEKVGRPSIHSTDVSVE
jgi:Protein of unknown function (DUF3431)